MIVACYRPLPLSACMVYFDLVSILFGTSIPTSFNILVKMFLHLYIQHQHCWRFHIYRISRNKCREGLRMLLLLHAIIPCLHRCMNCNCNKLFTVHHSGHYNLVSLIFGTTIPTSFNILMKCFFTLVSLIFLGYIPSSVHFKFYFFVDCFTIPTCLFYILLVTMSQQEYSY